MKTLAFEGYSDDTFGEYGVTHDDYDCCANGAMIVYRVTVPDVTCPDLPPVGMLVCGQYASKQWLDEQPGCWLIGLQQLDEGISIPSWPMRWSTAERSYSPRLEIDVPDDVVVECLNRKNEHDDD